MADNKCWMVDNLKYVDMSTSNTSDNTTGMTYNQGDHRGNGGSMAYNTVNESSTQSDANSNKAFYSNPMVNTNCYGSTNLPANSLTHCGYLYNWYAATDGTGTYAQSIRGTMVTGSICPANFRLPTSTSNGSTAASTGTSYDAADIPVLNASMNTGSLTTGTTTGDSANWQPSGAWGGSFSGFWRPALTAQGSVGYFWSSTVNSATIVNSLYFGTTGIIVGAGDNKYLGLAVRCVLP